MDTFNDLINQPITLQKAEVCTYVNSEVNVADRLTRLVRARRGLPYQLKVAHRYLHLWTAEGIECWYGPFDDRANISLPALLEKVRLIGRRTSIAKAAEKLSRFWDSDPFGCSAIDCVLWDAICRDKQFPLWRAQSEGLRRIDRNLPFYGSVLGLPTENVDLLSTVLEEGYPVAKWSLNRQGSVLEQIREIGRTNIRFDRIALDGHGSMAISEVIQVQDSAPEVAWLEDPFPLQSCIMAQLAKESRKVMPPLVIGENQSSTELLLDMARNPAIGAVNLEVEILGITRTILLIRYLEKMGKPCHLHGRALVTSSHLAAMHPKAVRWVEIHLAFALERLATLRDTPTDDPRTIVEYCLEREGVGVQPSATSTVRERTVIL
ncbi:MAG: hypothetical protein HY296_06120 [Thaumarchaeota archaeon]|nr:hypothetical protein [Nitrososphaerota archaeon]